MLKNHSDRKMDHFSRIKYLCLSTVIVLMLLLGVSLQHAQAQLKEPEVISNTKPATPYGQGYTNRWGIDILINNFGFGLSGNYARIIGPYTELTFQTGITGLRDVSEQNFQDFFTGQQTIPNKYNRALAFPLLIGIKQRLFADKIADNFRFFLSASAGPALAFVYPYLDDRDQNGFRTLTFNVNGLPQAEPINDFFTGWSKGSAEWGGTGEFSFGVDFGSNFGRQTTVEFSYFFYYYPQGIQILSPNKPRTNANGNFVDENGNLLGPGDSTVASPDPGFSAQKFFGTPQISIIFGGLW